MAHGGQAGQEILLQPVQLTASPQPPVSILRRSVPRTGASSYTNMGADLESEFWGKETRA